jgi:hypothetical protein
LSLFTLSPFSQVEDYFKHPPTQDMSNTIFEKFVPQWWYPPEHLKVLMSSCFLFLHNFLGDYHLALQKCNLKW